MVAVATRSTPVAAVKKKRNVEKERETEIRFSCKQTGKGIQEQKKRGFIFLFFFLSAYPEFLTVLGPREECCGSFVF